ncbi:MAG TPA: hypothetical protein VG056_01395, partial [Pirellulales bacterium]|nr:hypothetical protein [Pirellulales bacterium]
SRNAVLARVEEYIKKEGPYVIENCIDDFRAAFVGRGGDIKGLDEEWSIGLITFVSAGFPGVPFRARGRGEERGDAWQFECCDGKLIRESSGAGERAGAVGDAAPLEDWPRPLEVSRVVSQAGSRRFIPEILSEQSATAQLGAITIKPNGSRLPRALIYVGPLEQNGYDRISGLVDNKYRVQQFRNLTTLRAEPTATADDPQGY